MAVLNVRCGARTLYLFLIAVQIAGALFVVWRVLPDFRQLAFSPGTQLPYLRTDDFATLITVITMQAAYWYRFYCVPVPFSSSRTVLSHILLFFGRLSFIFGASLFSVVVFRHLPELEANADTLLMARRGLLMAGMLFALFCFTLELERLGAALGGNPQNQATRPAKP
jgi:hypothetical protein